MTRTRLEIHEKMLLALLKASLNVHMPDLVCFEAAKPDDWKECAQLAKRQGVLALAWDGVCRLPGNLQPYPDLKISWALAVDKYEKRYAHYCETVHELSEFYKSHGIRMVQLKGVGLSNYYPVPSHREGGDIDVFTYSGIPDEMDDIEANTLADSLIETLGAVVDRNHPKHSHFDFKRLPVENHKTFLDLDRCPLSVKVESVLHECLVPKRVVLCGDYEVLIPSDDFNVLFVIFHALCHYGNGLSLHHLCDWACMIQRCRQNIPEDLRDRHFMRGVNAMTILCNEYLGTSAPVWQDDSMADELLIEILRPFDDEAYPDSGSWDHMVFKFRRFCHTNRTRNRFLHNPLWKNDAFWLKLTKSLKWHLSAPKRIFSK